MNAMNPSMIAGKFRTSGTNRQERTMNRKLWLSGLVGATGLALIFFGSEVASRGQAKSARNVRAATTGALAGTGTLSGIVKAPKEFKAARVYAKNSEKKVVYMVFTEGGRYQAVGLFPGTYEVSASKNGFMDSDAQKVTVTPGENTTADLTLKEGMYRPNQQMRARIPQGEPLLSYDELYPPGKGRELIERTCILCHGPDFLSNKHWDASQWNAAINLMQNPFDNAGSRLVPGTFTPAEREELIKYLVANFGPDSKPRGLATPDEPLDEKALGKAMFIEYHVSPLPDGTLRAFHDPHLSMAGDVWYVDTLGLTVGKVDPRTANWTAYPVGGPEYRGHGLTQDANGDIWVAGHTAFVRVDSKTGAIKYYPYEPDAQKAPHGNTPYVDSKQNIWVTLAWSSELAKWDRKTEEISRYKLPTDNSFAYGMVIDKNDKLWAADWWRCKVTKFDPVDDQFIEYSPLTRPCTMRRVSVDHSGKVWYALEHPGKIGELNPVTNKIIEYDLPLKWSFPYDIQEDHDYNLWIADSGRGGTLVKFDPRTKGFTYYPAPQRTDMPKIEISREDGIWYTTRAAEPKDQAIGVLYPDKSKITTLAAYY
jgi:streptogramin lyase